MAACAALRSARVGGDHRRSADVGTRPRRCGLPGGAGGHGCAARTGFGVVGDLARHRLRRGTRARHRPGAARFHLGAAQDSRHRQGGQPAFGAGIQLRGRGPGPVALADAFGVVLAGGVSQPARREVDGGDAQPRGVVVDGVAAAQPARRAVRRVRLAAAGLRHARGAGGGPRRRAAHERKARRVDAAGGGQPDRDGFGAGDRR